MNELNRIMPIEAVKAVMANSKEVKQVMLDGKYPYALMANEGDHVFQIIFTEYVMVYRIGDSPALLGSYKMDTFLDTVGMLHSGYMMREIKEQRAKEIEEGLNYSTAEPLYVVYSIRATVREHDSSYNGCTSRLYQEQRFGYYHRDLEKFITEDEDPHNFGMIKSAYDNDRDVTLLEFDDEEGVEYQVEEFEPLVEEYHDVFQSAFFTRKAAEAFIEMNKHNMNLPYIYVEHIERRNVEFNGLLK